MIRARENRESSVGGGMNGMIGIGRMESGKTVVLQLLGARCTLTRKENESLRYSDGFRS